jgi:hypothetical protein
MQSTGIFISKDDFVTWPEPLRNDVLQRTFGGTKKAASSDVLEERTSAKVVAENEHFAELSPGQAREFLTGVSNKIRTAIDVMVANESPFFHLKHVAAAVGVSPVELSGVWRGLTRRVRTVTSDPKAYLIFWHGKGDFDDDGEYADHKGELTRMTHASFRKALGIG